MPPTLVTVAQAQSPGASDRPDAPAPPPVAEPQVEGEAPFSELNEALTTARSRLTELTKAAEVAGELRERLQAMEAENRQLKSVLSQLQTDNSDLLSAQQSAERRLQELTGTADDATAEAKRLDEELVSMRWQNSQLSSSLSQAETAAREAVEELSKSRNELDARTESLEAAVDQSATEIARLQRELDAAKEQVLLAERRQAETATELAELQQTTEDSNADSDRLAKDLDSTITQLANAQTELTAKNKALEEMTIALTAAEGETGLLREQLTGNRSETEGLRERLETAEADLADYRTRNAGLEQQVELLRTAAGQATDAARQNLIAVESQIDEINAALASVKAEDLLTAAGAGAPGAGEAATIGTASTPADGESWIPRPSPPRDEGRRQLVAVTTPNDVPSTSDVSPLPVVEAEPAAGAAQPAATTTPAINLASLTTDLPVNRRQDAQVLLSQLAAAKDDRGLSMAVPGELLFAVNGEEIEPTAFEALAGVAELLNLYEQRDILIIGHTDAVGDANYNQQLSERRADLVKQYFVDNFELSAERFEVEGRGEQDPISSNATADGRNANRRVEVVILD